MTTTPLRIGVDFGGVLSVLDDRALPADEHPCGAPDMPGALESLLALKAAGHQLYLLSFCGRRRACQTAKALSAWQPQLFEALYFVKRSAWKADVCASLGLHLLIDDCLDILLHVEAVTPTRGILFDTWPAALGAVARERADACVDLLRGTGAPVDHLCYPVM